MESKKNWREKRLTEEYRERNRNILPHLKRELAGYYEKDLPQAASFNERAVEGLMKHINYLEKCIQEIEDFLGEE